MAVNWNNNQQWNIVDVCGRDGLLHYGRVIDYAKNIGLMIDYGDGRAPRPIPFGQIYGCKLEEFQEQVDQTTDKFLVDVLLRLQPNEPAKWYLGALLTGDFGLFGSFALVRITTPEALVVVPGNRVRRAQGRGQFLVTKGEFVKQVMPLPSGVASGTASPGPYKTAPPDQWIVERFDVNCAGPWMVATHVDGSGLHVLTITEQYRRKFDRQYRLSSPAIEGDPFGTFLHMLGMTPQTCTQRKRPQDVHDATKKRVPSLPYTTLPGAPAISQSSAPAAPVVPQSGNPSKGSSASSAVCRPQPAATTPSLRLSANPTTADVSGSLRAVPKAVLAGIFQCLDGVQQTRLRRVCSAWNDLLTSQHMSRLFRVPEESRLFEPLGARVCLLKRWTAQTKVIVYSALASTGSIFDTGAGDRFAEEQHCGSLLCTGRFFCCIFQEKKLPRLDELVLDNLAWEWHGRPQQRGFSDFVDHIRTELNCFASGCQRLVVNKISVMLSGNKIPVIVRLTDTRIEGQVAEDTLWDLLDRGQPALGHEDVACWTKWIGDNLYHASLGQVFEILNECQSADPRDCNWLRGKEWTCGDLAHLDLKQLNRITAHSLLKASCYRKPVLDW